MTVSSFDVVFYTVGFVVPGFVWMSALSILVPRRAVPSEVRFLGYLALSCINNGLWLGALVLIFKTGHFDQEPVWSAFYLFGIIFLSPALLGLVTGYFYQERFVSRFLGWLGFRTIDSTPTAWDWHFSRAKPYWVVVTLKNGSEVYGLFGSRSFAGDDPARRDLYVEAVFEPVESGEWAPVEDSGGMLISPDEIAVIEFRRLAEEHYD